MEEQLTTTLITGLTTLSISPKDEIVAKLIKYIQELELFNAAYDLVGADSTKDIIIRHILDSLSAYTEIKTLIDEQKKLQNTETITIGDIGTGGGLPGIPLAICFPEVNFILVERMSKRCAFLENCRAILNLQNLTVMNIEAEKCSQSLVDIAVFRAFRPLDKKMIQTLLKIIKTQGKLAAYKAKSDKIQEEMNGIATYVTGWYKKSLSVPFLENTERNLVIIPKN